MRSLTLLLLVIGCAPAVETSEPELQQCTEWPCDPEPVIQVPSGQFQTIQSALDAIAGGGTIRVRAGTYVEHLTIARPVRLRGARRKTVIAGPDPQRPVIRYLPGGGGALERLTITGGAGGIAGEEVQGALPAPLSLDHVDVERTGHGLDGSFSDLTNARSTFSDLSGSGVVIRRAREVHVERITARDNRGYGLFFENLIASPGCSHTFDHGGYSGNLKGGIAILGHACPVTLDKVLVEFNRVVGVDLWDAGPVLITGSNIRYTVPRIPDGRFGDGVRLWSSQAEVVDTMIEFSSRAGISMWGCLGNGHPSSLGISESELRCQAFDLNLETVSLHGVCDAGAGCSCGGGVAVTRAENTECGCPFAVGPCKAQSVVLESAPRPTP